VGFLKDFGSGLGSLAGAVLGGPIKLVGEVVDSDFIREVGDDVEKATARTGDVFGSLASGVYDVVGGIVTTNSNQTNEGLDEVWGTVKETAENLGVGMAYLAGRGYDVVEGIIDGNEGQVLDAGKRLLKVAAVGAIAIGVVDVIDGVDGVAEAADISDSTEY
jgi:hypothetical protein